MSFGSNLTVRGTSTNPAVASMQANVLGAGIAAAVSIETNYGIH